MHGRKRNTPTAGPQMVAKMVNTCCVFGCHKRGGRHKGVSFFLIPAIVTNQSDKTEELSARRHDAWISSINRRDRTPSTNSRVCSEHFVSGRFEHSFYPVNIEENNREACSSL